MRWLAVFLILVPLAYSDIVTDVRVAAAQGNLPLGDSLVNSYRGQRGVTPEMLEALSWLARRALDSDPHLATALGAAIEVQATVLAARGERSEALALLRKDLLAYGRTSI